jgi:cytochrome bd ubiquinol oxidase subunit II
MTWASASCSGWVVPPRCPQLVGLILRGVAFDFRVKVRAAAKPLWNHAFWAGSLLAATAQGWMLGSYILGFASGWSTAGFALLIAICLTATYTLLGATWIVLKTEGELQLLAVKWARRALALTALGVLAISIVTPLASPLIFAKWFSLPYLFLLLPVPLATLLLFGIAERSLRRLPKRLAEGNAYGDWVPFASVIGILLLAFYGLAYSLFPFLVVDRMTIWQAASAPESLKVMLVGALIVVPMIVAYTAFSYFVFRGKARALTYQ